MSSPRDRPSIGVSGPDRGGWPAWLFTRYAVHRAGGRAVRITPSRAARIDAGTLDGLILGGGADVGPEDAVAEGRAWSDPPRPRAQTILGYAVAPLLLFLRSTLRLRHHPGVDRQRDELELELLRLADRRRLPVLGICRGAQLINVYRGGTLVRDLARFYSESTAPWTVLPTVTVDLSPRSSIAAALGCATCSVNSLHRHAIGELGRGLTVGAVDRVGIIQAIERHDVPWLGVQWHPEYLPQRSEQRRLFAALIAASAACRELRGYPLRDRKASDVERELPRAL